MKYYSEKIGENNLIHLDSYAKKYSKNLVAFSLFLDFPRNHWPDFFLWLFAVVLALLQVTVAIQNDSTMIYFVLNVSTFQLSHYFSLILDYNYYYLF